MSLSEYVIILWCRKDGRLLKKSFRSYEEARRFERSVLEEGGFCYWDTRRG